MTSSTASRTTIIVALWRHRLNLDGLKKPGNVRLVVVGPPHLVANETEIDVYYQIESPISPRDQNFSALIQKIRELLANYGNSCRKLCAFEHILQRPIAKLRYEMDIDGILPENLEQFFHLKELKLMARKGGMTTVKWCSFGSVQGHAEAWIDQAKQQVGQYPMIVKPASTISHCVHTMRVTRNDEELRAWIRTRSTKVNGDAEYLVEECLHNGHEFTAVCSAKSGLIGTFATVNPAKTLFDSVRYQTPYAIEFLTVDQTRDTFPGVESFVIQGLKSAFSKITESLIFVKGFYKGHNSIYFMNASIDIPSESFAKLFYHSHNSKSWESKVIENAIDDLEPEALDNEFNMLINFPHCEGVLLHQTNVPKRQSAMRVAWRVAEGEELLDSDNTDDNVLQIFLRNPNRDMLLRDVEDISQNTYITIDRLSLIDKHNVCRRIHIPHKQSSDRLTMSGGNQLMRSCTTND
ncbi:hypothetical protein QR680_004303 [Steinernema hermaphroditum]|uniref:ATP-grasp domain-containing protein n=1 Tax=Steinernema hermaphroditum TaxID=289476 RepID=A0AA39LTG1_9BILA|nr:hypothetical protein QR680_004303 [Steinernema hermaphroditum]